MTDWEQCYLDGQTPWDKNAPSPPLVQWVQRARPSGRALVPGCGAGHDVAMLAAAGVDAIGLDIAPSAIARAKNAYPEHAARFVLGDLFATPSGWHGSFDLLFEHTCLCALPPSMRLDYEKAAHQLLHPGGLLVGIWFINPEMDPGETGPPFGIPVDELGALFSATRWQVIEDCVPVTGYPGRVGRERLRVLRKLA
jgi:SAM-dependent methyltransferase